MIKETLIFQALRNQYSAFIKDIRTKLFPDPSDFDRLDFEQFLWKGNNVSNLEH